MKSMFQKIPRKIQVLIVVVGALVIAGTALFSFEVDKVTAGQPWFASAITVITPKPPEVRSYNPGERFNFHADFQWIYCSNEGGGTVFGRTSNPSLSSEPFKNLSGWKRGAGGPPAGYTTSRSRGGKAIRTPNPYGKRAGGYSETIVAPNKPGTYRFQYEIEIRTPEGNKSRTGTATFKVRDLAEVDPGNCPANQIPITRNNAQVCVPRAIDLTCTSSASRIEPGESVTFTATANQQVSFTWYNGSGTGGAVIGGPQSGTESSLTRTYANTGIYQVTALARNASGQYGMCTRGVTVGDVEEEDEFEEVIDEFGNIITDESITTPDGRSFALDPSAGPATITFELDRELTNTTCKGTWVAQNAATCYMVAGDDVANAPSIATSGNQDLSPAKYQVQCLSIKDGSIAKSPERLCRSNLDTREQ
jgi:hypothetical protein